MEYRHIDFNPKNKLHKFVMEKRNGFFTADLKELVEAFGEADWFVKDKFKEANIPYPTKSQIKSGDFDRPYEIDGKTTRAWEIEMNGMCFDIMDESKQTFLYDPDYLDDIDKVKKWCCSFEGYSENIKYNQKTNDDFEKLCEKSSLKCKNCENKIGFSTDNIDSDFYCNQYCFGKAKKGQWRDPKIKDSQDGAN